MTPYWILLAVTVGGFTVTNHHLRKIGRRMSTQADADALTLRLSAATDRIVAKIATGGAPVDLTALTAAVDATDAVVPVPPAAPVEAA